MKIHINTELRFKMHNNAKPESDGLFHLVSNVIVRHVDGDFLLMQRDYNKTVYPGMFEASVTGGAVKGESAEECALRELKEETGIDGANLEFICIYADKISNALFHIFLYETDCNKQSYFDTLR